MKKILFLHDSLEMGGAEQLRLTLLRNIDKSNYQVRVCCISNKGTVGEKIQNLGFPVDELKLSPHPKNIFTTLKLIKYLKSQKIDILHTSLFNANFHGRIAGFICRIPRIISEVHGQHYEFDNFKYPHFLFAEKLLFWVTDSLICCSESSRQDMIKREKFSPEKITAITNCIDPSAYRIKEPREEVRKKLGIIDELVLITVASFWEIKGHIYLLQALSELKQLNFRFKWICAGEGPLRNKIQRLCADLKLNKNIIFLGRVNNIADYLHASDVFILPSLSEALSIALLEAMSLGLPCIVTDVGSNRELIEDKVNGILVKPKDKEGLKNAIIYCFNHKELLKEFGETNRKKIEREYLFSDNYLKKFYEIWENGSIKI